MTLMLRIELMIFSLFCIITILIAVKKEKLLMKYALIWLTAAAFMIISVSVPKIIYKVSSFLGFEVTSNMIFFLGIILLLYIVFILTMTISKQAAMINLLIQEVSLLKHKEGDKK